MEKLVMTPTEASRVLATRTDTIRNLLECGELPAYREGRNWKIPVDLLKQYICDRAMEETRKRRSNAQ